MGKFITNFATTAELATASASTSFDVPHVSLTKDDYKIHYFQAETPPEHDYVTIGGLKWATVNLGGNAVGDRGELFSWAETETKDTFKWGTYKYSNASSAVTAANMTKYNANDNLTVLEASDDAVTANWGGGWRTPTYDEWQALKNATNSGWTHNYNNTGVACLILKDKTDESVRLILPTMSNGYGYYWGASLHSSDKTLAYALQTASVNTYNGEVFWNRYNGRAGGYYFRGVHD